MRVHKHSTVTAAVEQLTLSSSSWVPFCCSNEVADAAVGVAAAAAAAGAAAAAAGDAAADVADAAAVLLTLNDWSSFHWIN